MTALSERSLEGALATAKAFVEARAAFDLETAIAYALEGNMTGFWVNTPEAMAGEFAWLEAIGWTIEIHQCTVANPDLTNTKVTCDATHANAPSQALGVGPYSGQYSMTVLYAGDVRDGQTLQRNVVSEVPFRQVPSIRIRLRDRHAL